MPGETIRTPLMGFVEYTGLTPDEQTNAWRHYYINDVMRKIDGELTPVYTGPLHRQRRLSASWRGWARWPCG